MGATKRLHESMHEQEITGYELEWNMNWAGKTDKVYMANSTHKSDSGQLNIVTTPARQPIKKVDYIGQYHEMFEEEMRSRYGNGLTFKLKLNEAKSKKYEYIPHIRKPKNNNSITK